MNQPAWLEELQILCEAVVEDRLTDEQRRRLEELVLGEAEARRYYVEYLHQHGCLHWSAAEPAFLPRIASPDGSGDVSATPQARERSRRRSYLTAMLVAAAIVIAIVGLGFGVYSMSTPSALATLSGGKGCKWDAGTLPTEVNARLAAGRLRLAEGIAHITFDNGAEVRLEGPADLELISRQKCVLHSGRLIAKVPHQAIGFVVDTPTAVLKDLGTEFGVHVRDEQTADVQVFDGMVDVKHRASGQTERLLTGRNRRFASDNVADFDPLAEKPSAPPRPDDDTLRVVHISTASGRGKDAYVQPLFPSEHSSDILLLVKNTLSDKSNYHRKAYIGLDLAPVAGTRIVDAQLSFTFTPTGLGFASEVPDATFIVYGLLDEGLDTWDAKTIRWNNAPANRPGGANLDLSKVVRLGTFEIAQGALQGTRSISGPTLVDFLNRDTTGVVTFILVRQTVGSGRTDLVHGFANKHHPHLPPPTLKLGVLPK